MFCASDGPWGLSCISHVQNPFKSTSGFPGRSFWGRSFQGPLRIECTCLSQRNCGREELGAGAFREVGISKSCRKYQREEVWFNICQIEGRSHWLSKNCWLLCSLPHSHMCTKGVSVGPKQYPVGRGGSECRWAERTEAEATHTLLLRQAEEAEERWVKKPHQYQSEGFDQHLGLSRLISDTETLWLNIIIRMSCKVRPFPPMVGKGFPHWIKFTGPVGDRNKVCFDNILLSTSLSLSFHISYIISSKKRPGDPFNPVLGNLFN